MCYNETEAPVRILLQKHGFSFSMGNKWVESTFKPVIDYRNVLHMNASAHRLCTLDTMY